ncbi:MAG TPA: LamG-like jellyroll fold domain-containing protein [Candidatus Eisenbacteria bacterium]|nr:LamG-like jellyroll fold domain-containing protein [Candidatus Eisenbacteria bacterium]
MYARPCSTRTSWFPALLVVFLAIPSLATAQSAQFDGTNDYVTFGAAPGLGATTFTIEVAFKRTGPGVSTSTGTGGIAAAVPLLAKGRGEADGDNRDMNYFLGISSANVLVADYEEGAAQASPGLNHPVTGRTVITDNVWHHAAATFDGTTWRLYLDGQLDTMMVVGSGRLPRFDSIQHAALGSALTSAPAAAGFFQGRLDEARVWNVARSQVEIQAAMGVEIFQGSGLIGRWGMNEGTGSTAGNSVAGGVQGTLTNGPVWSSDSSVPLTASTGLRFGGSNAYATFGNPTALRLPAFTIELWVRRDGAGAGTNTGTGGIPDAIPLVAKGRAEAETAAADINYLFGIRASDGVLCADFEEGAAGSSPGLNHPVAGTTPVTSGVWHHVAVTYDGTWRLYLDGGLDATLAVGQPVNAACTSAASLASALTTASAAAGFFDGAVDEVRIWNVARTQGQIISTINSQLTGPESGLVARWGLNEDAGLTIASSAGTALNGTLTGTVWSWTAPAPFSATPPPTFALTTAVVPNESGTILADPGGPLYMPGSQTQLTASPSTGYHFLSWSGDLAGSGNPQTLTLDADKSVTASFEINTYTITASAGPNGSIAPLGPTVVTHGDSQGYVITPNAGYHVLDVLVDGASVGPVTAYTFPNVSASHTIAATFEVNGEALGLNGTDGWVDFANPSDLKLNQFTIEMWVRRDGTGVGTNTGTGGIADLVPLLSKGRADQEDPLRDINYILGVRASTGVLAADFEEAAAPSPDPSLNHPIVGATPLTVGIWYHVAATYDGTTWKLYLNGALDAEATIGRPAASTSDCPVALGSALTTVVPAAGFFHGRIDEVRVWNVARTAAQILSTINDEVTTPTTDLVARWGFEEGSGTLVQSTAGTPLDGTITGGGYAWTAAAPFDIQAPAAPTDLVADAVSAGQVNLTWTDTSSNEARFEVDRSTSGIGGPFVPLLTVPAGVTTASDTGLAPSTEHCYRVRAVNGAGVSADAGPACATTGSAPSYALDFDGNTYVSFGDPAALDLAQFTIETWFRRDGAGTTVSTGSGGVTDAIPLVTHGTSQADGSNVDMNFFLGIKSAGSVLCADFEEGAAGSTPGLNHPIVGVTPIANGVWHHAAATYDGSVWRLYLDGNLENQATVGQPVQAATIQLASLASSITSTGTAQGFFVGALDEARVWNSARSQAQIQGTANARIDTPTPGLVARWGLDEGSGTAVNGSAGTSVNGSITGAAFAWVAGAPFDLAFNAPPDPPALIAPAHQATGVSLSPSLQVTVSDPDGGNLTVDFHGRSALTSPGEDFTIIGMPDTQYYTSELNGATNAILLSQTNWIVANRASREIAYVATLGDCVEHGDNGGNDIEWQRAVAGYSLIENPGTTGLDDGVPYGITVGNHDQSPNGDPAGTTTFYNQYFGESRFLGRDYYGGHHGSNNDNWFNLFRAGGMDFIVISMEYDTTPDAAVLAWADALLTTYSERRAIVLAHNLAGTGNPASFSAQGQATYDALKGHSNFFLMLCGHVPGEGRRSDTFNGNTVTTLMSDYQGRTNGGNGWLRILTFSPANNVIHVETYSPWLDQFETDADSRFDVPYEMSATEPFAMIGSVPSASGAASLIWPGLVAATPYEWRVTVSDGLVTTTGPTWRFTTQTAPNHTLAVDAAPPGGGTVAPSPVGPVHPEGTLVQVTATPAAGWEFRSWCGDASGSSNPVPVSMTRSKSAVAIFAEVGSPTVSVLAPNGGETLTIGGVTQIEWNATDAEGVESVDVLLSRSGPAGPFEVLGTAPNTGRFTWAVSHPGTQNAFVQVVAHNPAGASPSLSAFDRSDAAFTIPDVVTGIDEEAVTEFSMRLNSRNPTSAGAAIAFALPREAPVRIDLFDVNGRLVETVADALYPAGRHSARWSGHARDGNASSGVYFIRLRTPGHTVTRRIVVIR